MLHWLLCWKCYWVHEFIELCPNKQVLATLLQDFLFFISLPPNQYKITNIKIFHQPLHTKSGDSTLKGANTEFWQIDYETFMMPHNQRWVRNHTLQVWHQGCHWHNQSSSSHHVPRCWRQTRLKFSLLI